MRQERLLAAVAYAVWTGDGERPIADFDVLGGPATFATAREAAWKLAVREAGGAEGVEQVPGGCLAVRIAFRTPAPQTANDRWDIDNLVKPTLDAMEGIFGLRAWAGVPQPNDDRVIRLEASKRRVELGGP
jgi:Holliday junction resolvase RusA-like endonuclease